MPPIADTDFPTPSAPDWLSGPTRQPSATRRLDPSSGDLAGPDGPALPPEADR